MALTTLDPHTALIVVDLQKGIVAFPLPGMAEVVERGCKLAKAFRAHGLSVVLVNVTGGAPGRTEQGHGGTFADDFADLVPELDQQPGDHLVTKRTWGAFSGTDLDAWLKGQGVTQVAVVGVATSIGVESTARQAHELGYHVTLAVDAMLDLHPDSHANSIERLFPRLGETGTTDELLALLSARPA